MTTALLRRFRLVDPFTGRTPDKRGETVMVTSQRPALAAYLAAFKPLCLVPVIGPADLQAGDAVAGLCAALLARRGDSFTNPVTWEAPALLPPIELAARAAAQFALGIAPEEDGLHALGCG